MCELCWKVEGLTTVKQMYHYVAKEIGSLFRSELDQKADQ